MSTNALAAFGAGIIAGFVLGVMTAAILAAIANKIDREETTNEKMH